MILFPIHSILYAYSFVTAKLLRFLLAVVTKNSAKTSVFTEYALVVTSSNPCSQTASFQDSAARSG